MIKHYPSGNDFALVTSLMVAALVALFPLSGEAADLAGRWEGAFVRENSVQLLSVNLADSAGQLVGTYEIPEMGLYEQPIRELAITDSTVTMRFLYGPFVLRRSDDIGQLTGGNDRWNPAVQLHLKRSSQPYRTFFSKEPVVFTSGGEQLTGTIYLPEGTGPYPGLVLIHGSGDQSRAVWEYRSHVYRLVSRGVAVLAYDKRGCGESEGAISAAGFDDLAADAYAALSVLRTAESIDSTRCGLFGISQGGWIAARLGAAHRDISFIVFNEGPAVSLWQQELDRVAYSLKSDDFSQAAIDSAVALTRLYFESVDRPAAWAAYATARAAADSAAWLEYVQNEPEYDNANMIWWRTNRYDPAADLSRLSMPVLAVFGELDTNVPPQTNRLLMDSLLTAAGVAHSSMVIPNLAHSVTTFQTLRGGEWNWPTGFWQWAYRPDVDNEIAEWILTQ